MYHSSSCNFHHPHRHAFRSCSFRSLAPCIIFIDELDAVGRARSTGGQRTGNDERDTTVNQLLTEMDGFEAETQARCGLASLRFCSLLIV